MTTETRRQLDTLFRVGALGRLGDAELLELFLGRREAAEAAFAALVERHGPTVLRACRRVLSDPNDAQDAFQATFLALVRRADSVRQRDSVGSWLFGVALRVARRARVDAARRRAREWERAAREGRVSWCPEQGADEGFPGLLEEIERLPEAFRRPVVLHHLEGLSVEEAARRLGCPRGTILSRLARARRRLRRQLTRRGLAPAVLLGAGPDPARWALSRSLVDATVAAGMSLARARAGGVIAPGLARLPAARGAAAALFGVLLGVAALVGLRTSAGGPPAPAPGGRLVRPSLAGHLGPAFERPEIVAIDLPVGTPSSQPSFALQPDGKFLVVSVVRMPGGKSFEYILARYHPDGAHDATFGEGGHARAGFDPEGLLCESARLRIAVQPDGKILLAAPARVPGESSQAGVGVQRFRPDGATDPSFGADGIAVLQVGHPARDRGRVGSHEILSGLALQPDGKILLGGTVYSEVGEVFLARLRPDGALDEGFGDGGWVTTVAPRRGMGPQARLEAWDLALGPGGRIALAGTYRELRPTADDLALLVYDSSGRRDPGLGDGGRVAFDLGAQWDRGSFSRDAAHAVAFAPDGGLLVAGSTTAGAPRDIEKLALARFDRAGRLDPHFGDGGVAILGLQGRARALALQPDGRILVGGHAVPVSDLKALGQPYDPDEGALVLTRLRADGTPDPGFGVAGRIRVHRSQHDEVEGLALKPDGTVLAVGSSTMISSNGGRTTFFLLRHRRR